MPVTAKQQKTFFTILLFLAAAFALILPACYNGFPLVTSDTGAYINSGWDLHVPIDRPISYGIFIRIFSLSGFSLWGVIIAQTLILVYFLRRVSSKLLGEYYRDNLFLALMLFLGAFTSAGWTASQVMPDVFTPILFLAIADFYLSPVKSAKSKVLYFFLLWFFMEQHNSNMLIALVLCVAARFYYLFSKNKWFYRKTVFLFLATLFSFISISFFNLWEGNSFRPSASTHVFMMSRMAENGILDEFLKEYCPTEHYSICNYQGNTGDRQWDFMWGDHGHLQAAGSWQNTENEYSTIVRRSFMRPKYLAYHIYESLEASLRQLPQFNTSLFVMNRGSSPYTMVEQHFPRELKEYRSSWQQLNILPGQMSFFNGIAFIFIVIVSGLALLRFDQSRKDPGFRNLNFFLVLLAVWLVINAWVTATFSTVVDRLQARVFWLLPFACLLILVKQYYRRREKSGLPPDTPLP